MNPQGLEPGKRLLTRRELGEFLRGEGFPIGNSTINKLCSPSINDGPPVAAWFGRRALHSPDDALTWARARLTSARPRQQSYEVFDQRGRIPRNRQFAESPVNTASIEEKADAT
jgi:hypothetical protein